MVFCIYEIAKVRYFHTINMVYFKSDILLPAILRPLKLFSYLYMIIS